MVVNCCFLEGLVDRIECQDLKDLQFWQRNKSLPLFLIFLILIFSFFSAGPDASFHKTDPAGSLIHLSLYFFFLSFLVVDDLRGRYHLLAHGLSHSDNNLETFAKLILELLSQLLRLLSSLGKSQILTSATIIVH